MLIWALVLALAALVPTGLRLWRTALSERAPVEALLDSGLTVESLPPYAGALSVELEQDVPRLSPRALPPEASEPLCAFCGRTATCGSRATPR